MTATASGAPRTTAAPASAEPAWTGFYVGATGGAAWSKATVSANTVNGPTAAFIIGDIPGLNSLGSPEITTTNAIFGGELRYNQQWNMWVVGLEADFSYWHVDKTATTTGKSFHRIQRLRDIQFEREDQLARHDLSAARLRHGPCIDLRNGGAAIATVSFSNTFSDFSPNEAGFGKEASAASKTKVGAGRSALASTTPSLETGSRTSNLCMSISALSVHPVPKQASATRPRRSTSRPS